MVKKYLAYVMLFILMAGGSAAVTVAVLPGAALPERVQTGEQVTPPTEEPDVGGNEASGPIGAIISAAEKLTAEPTEIAAKFTAQMNGVTLASGNVTVRLALNMQDLAASKAGLTGTVTALGGKTEFSAYYGDSTAYLDLFGKRVKVENARIADLFSVLSQYINLPMPDLSGMDLNALTSVLAGMTERETEDGGKEVVLTVDPSALIAGLSAFDVTVAISADGRLESLALPDLSASGVEVSVSAAFSAGDFTLAPPEGDATDLGFLPELVDATMNTAGLKAFRLSGEVSFGGLGVRLNRALIDTVRGGFTADAVITYGETELPVSLTYLDGTLYASVLGKRVKANLSKLSELLPLFGVDAAGPLPQLPSIGFEQIEEWLAALNGITYENGVLAASVNAGALPGCSGTAALSLSIENGYLSRLELHGLNVGENALALALALENPGDDAEIPQPDGAQYIDLDFLPEFLSAAMNTAQLKGFDLSGVVTAGDASVRLNALKLDITNGLALSGDLSANVAGMALNAQVAYADGVAYVSALGKRVRISLNTLPELLDLFNVARPEVSLPSLQVQDIAGYLSALKSLSFENGKLNAVLDASVLPGCSGNVTLSVALNGGYLGGLSLTGMNAGGMDIAAELTLNRPGEAVRVDVPDGAEYIDLDFLPEFLSAAMNTAALKGFDLSGVVTAGDASVRLNALKLDMTNGIVLSGDLSANVAGMALNAQAAYADGVAYVTALGKRVRISLNTLPELLDLFNVALPEVSLPALQVQDIAGYLSALQLLTFENGELKAVLDASVLPGCSGNVTLSVALNNGYLGGLTLTGLNAGGMDIAAELTLNRPGEAVRVDVPDGAGYIDLDFLPEFLSAAVNTAAQRSFGVTGSVSYGGLRVMLDRLDLSLAGALGVDAAVRVEGQGIGLSLNAVLADGVLYATAGGRKLSLPQDALLKTLALFGAEGVQLPQITVGEIEKYLSYLVSLDYADGALTAVMDASVLPGCSARMALTLSVANGSLGGVTVRGLNVGGAELSAELAIAEKEVNIAPPQGAYEDFSFLPELASGVMNSLLGKTAFGLDAVVEVRGGTALTGEKNYLRAVISDFALDLADGLKVAGRLDLTGALNVTGSLAYGGNRLYLNYLGLAVSLSDAKLMELAGLLVPALGSGMGALELPKPKLTDAGLAELFSYVKSVTAQRVGGETLITVTLNGSKLNLAADLPVTLTVDEEGYLSRLELTGFVSPLDGSTVDVRVNLKRSGAAAVMPQPEDYENLDALPQIAEAVMNTAALNEFNLSAAFTVWQQGGVLKADPRLRIALDETRAVSSVAGNAKVASFLADGSANAQGLNLDLGFWLENDWIYANANSMKLRLRLSSVGEIVNSISRLMGGGSVDIMNTVNALVETFLSNINEVISDISVAEDGSEIVIRLNSRVLYPEAQLAEGETVDIRVGISPEKLLTSIGAVNVRNGSDRFDFTILRTDAPPETQPVGDPEGYIDVSAASKLIDAFLTTAGYKYFHIKGSVGILSITRNIDLQVKVFEDGSFNFRLLMDGGSGLDWFKKYYDQNIAYYDGNYVYFQCRDLWSDGSVRNDNSYKMTLETFLNNPIPPVKDMVDSWVLDIVPDSAFTGGGEAVDYFKILNKMSIDVAESGTTVATTLNGKVLSSMLSETFTLNLRINNASQLTHIDVEKLKLLGLVDVKAALDLIDLGQDKDSVLDFAHDPSEYTLRT